MMNRENSKQVAGSHTPGPWKVGDKVGRAIYGADDSVVAMCDSMGEAVSDEANARRIVACVNACEGVPTELLEDYPAPFSELRTERDQLETKVADTELALFSENQKRADVERERDQLLAALEALLAEHAVPSSGCKDRQAYEQALAAIAAVKSGA